MKKTGKIKAGINRETATSLKKESHQKNGVKKGYNEKNPTQPQGAFVPDALANKTKSSK